MQGYTLSGLFKDKSSFFFVVFFSPPRLWQVSSAIRLKNRPIVCVDLVAYCDEGLRQTGVFKSAN